MTQASAPKALKARLLAMMVLRVVLTLAFLSITAWFQLREYPFARLNLYPLYFIAALFGFITIFYSLALNRVRNLTLFTYVQVTVDIVLVTGIVYVTGGTESYLHTLYPLSVIGAAILLNRRGGFYAASVSSIAYGILIDMDFYSMLPSRFKVIVIPSSPAWEDVFTTVATNILAFFTVAYLSGYLAERTARVERELEEKEIDYERLEALNRQIVENITSGIMTLDEANRITSFNMGAENVTGYTLKDVYFKDVNEIFPGILDLGPGAGQAGMRVEKWFRKKGGDDIFLGFSLSRGRGGDASAIIIFQDLTQLKDMEEQLRRDEKLKALGELSVGIAHEIRNPLASISGSIQVLRDELNLEGDNRLLMEIVLRETDRLNTLITDYLLFARPAQTKRERIDLGAVISETLKVFGNSPEAALIKIETDVHPGVFMRGDSRQIGQIFWNLFLNAAHAMAQGGTLSVTSMFITVAGRESGGSYGPPAPFVVIKVADTGEGIPQENINRLFDPFFSTKDSGTGLGLAIVHRIVESHGGSISVASKAGAGSVFKVFLPLEGEAAV